VGRRARVTLLLVLQDTVLPAGQATWAEVWLTLLITVFLVFGKMNIFGGKKLVVFYLTQITFTQKKNPKK